MSVRVTEADVRLTPKPWMTNSYIRKVLRALNAKGKEARFVGGCVRDELLKLPVNEVDLATPERPEIVIQLMRAAGIKVLSTGIKHGTVTAVISNKQYQITSLRIDTKTNGRHALVDFTEDWKKDAMRRDFTINALSASPKGIIYDYVNGLQDLSEKRIKFVGQAEHRIREDHLRILRYFRFIASKGFLNDDKKTHQICVNQSFLLSNLSGERIRDELFKILVSNNYNDVIGMMIGDGVTNHFLPEAVKSNLLNKLIRLEEFVTNYEHVIVNPIRRLATLFNSDHLDVNSIATRLKMSNDQREILKSLLAPKWNAVWNISDNNLRAGLYQFGSAYIIDLSLIKWAQMLEDNSWLPKKQTNAWLRIVRIANQWKGLSFPVKGQDLVNLGIKEGPEISRILKQLEIWWINRGCLADRATCLNKLRKLLEQ